MVYTSFFAFVTLALSGAVLAVPTNHLNEEMGSEMSKSSYEMGNSYEMGKSYEAEKSNEMEWSKDMEKSENIMTEHKMMTETMMEPPMETKEASHEMAPPPEPQVYGSGSMESNNYNDCVQQCIAKHGAPPSMYTPPPSNVSQVQSGSGTIHTVIVAPSQGVLRYVPPFLNASSGDTVKFIWNANVHTVTKSSQLTPCNKSLDSLFTSGSQNQSFEFTQLVNDTNQVFFFCNTPGHCQKGMFGIINPNSVPITTNTSMAMMMQSYMSESSELSAYNSYTQTSVANNAKAGSWGQGLDMAGMPDWAGPLMAENILYTRNFLAMNPDVQKEDGTIDMSAMGTNPAMFPQDIGAVLNAAASSDSAAPGATTSSAPSSDASPVGAAASSAPQPNSAGLLTSSKAVVGLMAAFATYLLL